MRLLASDGTIVRGRCKATNRCDYCSRMESVEFAEALALDALESGNAPRVWLVLTTRTATHDTARFYRSREYVQRAVRRRWPQAEFCWIVEFTTGYGTGSGGERRPHWNALVKNVPPDALAELHAVVCATWCANEDAEPQAQHVGEVYSAGGLMKYLALHFLKESQRPPKGWRGHRTTFTRGYFGEPMRKVRDRARASLREKRAVHRAIAGGLTGEEAETVAAADVLAGAGRAWQAVIVSEKIDRNGELKPRLRALAGGEPTVRRRPRQRSFQKDQDHAGALRALDEIASCQVGEDAVEVEVQTENRSGSTPGDDSRGRAAPLPGLEA